ncbi:MAG TPA: MFS transporter [Acidimicrobiales bacterium]|nr:MFS transporter [Acidimicrobiales bacterium]
MASVSTEPPPRAPRAPRARRVFGRVFPELAPPLRPFGRLAVTHVLMIGGDAFMTVALAGSLFFSISPHAARGHVLLYLALTMAPFAVVAPALGPLLDKGKGARRAMVMGSAVARVVLCLLMARHLHSLLLFPEAFGVLVCSKIYLVAKAALVPAVVETGPELVRANSRLALLAAVFGLAASGPAIAILKFPGLGAAWVLRADALLFVVAAFSAYRLPHPGDAVAAGAASDVEEGRARPGAGGWDEDDTAELPLVGPLPAGADALPAPGAAGAGHAGHAGHAGRTSPAVQAGAMATSFLRLVVGLVTFLLAFELRRQHAAAYWYGAMLVASILGSFVATVVSPLLRRFLREEAMLLVSLAALGAAGALAFELGGRQGDLVMATAVGLAAGTGKLAFDSMVQRDVPEDRRGRAFARFETRFQLAWVLGALVPVAVSVSSAAGELAVACGSVGTAVAYLVGRRRL